VVFRKRLAELGPRTERAFSGWAFGPRASGAGSGRQEREFVFISVGRLVEKKGHEYT
jgi:hypothetical protein